MTAPAHSGRAHARISPSGLSRVEGCPGSLQAEDGLPNTSSEAADEGTAAHTVCEHCLARNIDADAYLGLSVDVAAGVIQGVPFKIVGERVFEVTEEMADAVQVYLDFCRPLCDGAEVEFEAKLDLRHIPGMEFGTGDFCAYNPTTKVLDIADFKYGKGVVVEAEKIVDGVRKPNMQLGAYASGVLRRYHNRGVKKIRLTIVQPRAYHFSGPVRTAEFGPLDFMDFEVDVGEVVAAALAPNAPFVAGDWCRFCKVKECPTREAVAHAVAADAFGEIVDPRGLSQDEIAERLRKVYLLKAWLKTFEEHAHAEAMAGRVPTGFKLIPKRPTRKWVNPDKVAADIMPLVKPGVSASDLCTKPELKSPAQVEPLLAGKNKEARAIALSAFTQSVSSGTNLVPDEDPREKARPDASDVFAS